MRGVSGTAPAQATAGHVGFQPSCPLHTQGKRTAGGGGGTHTHTHSPLVVALERRNLAAKHGGVGIAVVVHAPAERMGGGRSEMSRARGLPASSLAGGAVDGGWQCGTRARAHAQPHTAAAAHTTDELRLLAQQACSCTTRSAAASSSTPPNELAHQW